MIKNNFILAVVSIILAAQIAWAQVPATISYQGILTDVDGNIVADGDYALTFNLYDVLSGESSI
ncbi:MAG: hypothetical protein GXO75_21675 [Calditrichaeota bacterium]|nr:hypothetical protein [Calditrichota bacterium]